MENRSYLWKLVSLMPLVLGACSTTEKFQTTKNSVKPGTEILWLGEKTPLYSQTKLEVGSLLPETVLTNLKMKDESIKPDGKVKLVSVLPSLDTPVCEVQTHILGESKELNLKVERITVSVDLPYAQRRFSDGAKLGNITYLSDYRTGNFGRQTGLQIQRNGLLARTVIVVDGNGIVRYIQVVPEITQMPDMKKAFAVANMVALEGGSANAEADSNGKN